MIDNRIMLRTQSNREDGLISNPHSDYLCATVTLAAVESSNVVGYMNKAANPGGGNLLATSFKAVNGSDARVKLYDVKVTGFEDSEYWQNEGTYGGDFYFQKLTAGGALTGEEYGFYAEWDGEQWNTHWEGVGGEVEGEITEESEVYIGLGEGLWFTMPVTPDGEDDVTYSLVSSGEVLTGQNTKVALGFGGGSVIGNPYPTRVNLWQTYVTGFENSEYWQNEGTYGGDFYYQKLTAGGALTGEEYGFYAEWDGELWSTHWEGVGGSSEGEITSENPAYIEPGEGLWFSAPTDPGDLPTDPTTGESVPYGLMFPAI